MNKTSLPSRFLRLFPTPKQTIVIILALLTFCLAIKVCSVGRKADALQAGVKVGFSSSPSPSVAPYVRPKPSADPAEEADLRHHHAAIARCTDERRIAVIGYGWKIVCIDPKFVAW